MLDLYLTGNIINLPLIRLFLHLELDAKQFHVLKKVLYMLWVQQFFR